MVSSPVLFAITTVMWAGCMIVIYRLINKRNVLPSNPVSVGQKETYIDPIFLNPQKMQCDNYPRSNNSIYGEDSNILTGFPFYKAY